MPFVMLCGLPSSGKTHVTNILANHLREQLKKNVVIINENNFLAEKNSIYIGRNQ